MLTIKFIIIIYLALWWCLFVDLSLGISSSVVYVFSYLYPLLLWYHVLMASHSSDILAMSIFVMSIAYIHKIGCCFEGREGKGRQEAMMDASDGRGARIHNNHRHFGIHLDGVARKVWSTLLCVTGGRVFNGAHWTKCHVPVCVWSWWCDLVCDTMLLTTGTVTNNTSHTHTSWKIPCYDLMIWYLFCSIQIRQEHFSGGKLLHRFRCNRRRVCVHILWQTMK